MMDIISNSLLLPKVVNCTFLLNSVSKFAKNSILETKYSYQTANRIDLCQSHKKPPSSCSLLEEMAMSFPPL